MNKEIKFKVDWLMWFLILLPTFYIVNKDLRHVQMNFFQFSVILMLATLHVNRWFGLFLAWASFQVLFFTDVNTKNVLLQNIFFAGVLYHFVVKYVGAMRKYFWTLFGILAVNVVWCGFQYMQYDPIFHPANPQFQTIFSDLSGFFGLPAFLGNYAAVVLPLCVIISPWLGLVAIPALIISKSSFSLVAAGAGLLFFLWFRKRLFFWILLGVFLVGGLFYVAKYDAPGGQFSRRLKVWDLVLQESFKKQFFGHGLGSYGTSYAFVESTRNNKVAMVRSDPEMAEFVIAQAVELKVDAVAEYIASQNGKPLNAKKIKQVAKDNGLALESWIQPHNEFLGVFFHMGFVGLFFLFGFVFNIFRRFFRASKKDPELVALCGAFLAILIVSFAHFPFQVARLAGPFIVIMAMLETKLFRSESGQS